MRIYHPEADTPGGIAFKNMEYDLSSLTEDELLLKDGFSAVSPGAGKVRIAQVGITHEHAPGKIATLRNMSEYFEIAGVWDDSAVSRTPHFYNGDPVHYEGLRSMTLEEILADETIEAVTVEVPNHELVPVALRCAERGLAIHMDKPAGENLALFRQLLEICREKSVPFQMGYMFRSNEAFLFSLRAIREKWIGEVLEIEADMHHNYGRERYQEYISRFQGGILYNLGCHLIDFAAAALGRPQKITPFMHSAPGYGREFRNHAMAVLEYEHAFVTLRACSKVPGSTSKRSMRITGTKGSISFSPLEKRSACLELHLDLYEECEYLPAGKHVLKFPAVKDRYRGQLLSLYKMIREGKESSYSAEHDLLVQEITLAASGCIQWH